MRALGNTQNYQKAILKFKGGEYSKIREGNIILNSARGRRRVEGGSGNDKK